MRLKKIMVLEGQIDIFNIPFEETIKPKEEKLIEIHKIKEDVFTEIINLYKARCLRIIKMVSGALLVEVEDKTMYFNKEGKNEFNLNTDIGIMPADEILVANKDKEVNELQLKKLENMHVDKYIKRKGDANVIIPMEDKTIVINPRGWVIEWEQKPNYKENEIVICVNSTKISDEQFQIGDTVEFEYEKLKQIGKVTRIYNGGETINVSWDGKHTAFYYKCLKKIA